MICALTTVLDPEQIAGISISPAYSRSEQASQVQKSPYYISLE